MEKDCPPVVASTASLQMATVYTAIILEDIDSAEGRPHVLIGFN